METYSKRVESGFFGRRDFFTRDGMQMTGELYAENGRYFAEIGHASYPADLVEFDSGKRWVVDSKPA